MQSNPPEYASSGTGDSDPRPATLVMPGYRVRAAAGVDWVSAGWRLFRKASLMWIVFLLLFFLIHVGLGFVPWVGMWIGNLVSPILMGGIALGCRSLETGGDLELEHFLAGFRRNTGQLLAIGVVYLLGEMALLAIFGLFAGPAFISAIFRGDEAAILNSLPEDMLRLALGGLVVAALALPLMAAYWFAPTLAMLHGTPALPAMKESLVACFRNFLPMLVYGLVMLALLVPAVIALGLGLFVWAPLMMATIYASYRSIFTEPDAEAG